VSHGTSTCHASHMTLMKRKYMPRPKASLDDQYTKIVRQRSLIFFVTRKRVAPVVLLLAAAYEEPQISRRLEPKIAYLSKQNDVISVFPSSSTPAGTPSSLWAPFDSSGPLVMTPCWLIPTSSRDDTGTPQAKIPEVRTWVTWTFIQVGLCCGDVWNVLGVGVQILRHT
jgi:hypothetical protein